MRLKSIPDECKKCINRHICLESGFAKDRLGCLARSEPSAIPQKEKERK